MLAVSDILSRHQPLRGGYPDMSVYHVAMKPEETIESLRLHCSCSPLQQSAVQEETRQCGVRSRAAQDGRPREGQRIMNRVRQFWRHPLARVGSVAALATVLLGSLAVVVFHPAATAQAASSCHLSSARGDIQHVIHIQFDNTHFQRDNPNVPSDLEQMPHLLNFITNNGTLMTNDHTVLISHTATGILSTLTGVYPDRMGQPVSNSFRYFTPAGTSRTGVSFAYWTAPLFDPAGSTTDNDQRERQDRASAVGSFYARWLQRRLCGGGEHHPREYCH